MSKPGVNVYDIRKECEGPLCYDFSDADAYLNSAGAGRGSERLGPFAAALVARAPA
jgi:hypothetical protein